jgi:hypothetical protein
MGYGKMEYGKMEILMVGFGKMALGRMEVSLEKFGRMEFLRLEFLATQFGRTVSGKMGGGIVARIKIVMSMGKMIPLINGKNNILI